MVKTNDIAQDHPHRIAPDPPQAERKIHVFKAGALVVLVKSRPSRIAGVACERGGAGLFGRVKSRSWV